MAKALLKTGSGLEQAKSINVFRNGAWHREQMGYVYFNGVWVPLMEYKKWIYEAGIEHFVLETDTGFHRGGEVNKKERYVEMVIGGYNSYAEVSFVIDTSEFSALNIEYEAHAWHGVRLNYHVGDNIVEWENLGMESPQRVLDTVDISDVKGEQKVSIRLQDRSTLAGFEFFHIYNIWLE